MGATLKNLTGAQLNIETAETGVEVQSFEVTYKPEYKVPFTDRNGQTTGFGVPDKMSLEISIEANVKGSTGLMAATNVTALTLGNDVNTFQATPGGIYMDEVTEKQKPREWRAISMKLSSNPECA
jgi:hypothetical protein